MPQHDGDLDQADQKPPAEVAALEESVRHSISHHSFTDDHQQQKLHDQARDARSAEAV